MNVKSNPDYVGGGTIRVRERSYKTLAGRKRAEKRYGSRVAWTGASSVDGKHAFTLGVFDLDEFGQPPVFVCPACGREIDE